MKKHEYSPLYYSPRNVPPRNPQSFSEPSMTKQEFAQEADINVLVGRYGIGNLARHPGEQFYFDATAVPDYHGAMNKMTAAAEQFAALPAAIRRRFGDRPNDLVEFLRDKNNRAEAEKLGLINAPPPPPAAPPPGSGGGEPKPKEGA